MGYLIHVEAKRIGFGISFDDAITQLTAIFTHIKDAFWAAASGMTFPRSSGSVVELRTSLPRIQLPELRANPGDVIWADEGDWELSEVHRQLCQVAVLIEALTLLQARHSKGSVTSLSPTQQPGFDGKGVDGTGGIWALEVFGGVNVRNNDKARRDARSLLDEAGISHRYFACFDDAWRRYSPRSASFTFLDSSAAFVSLYEVGTISRPSSISLRTSSSTT